MGNKESHMSSQIPKLDLNKQQERKDSPYDGVEKLPERNWIKRIEDKGKSIRMVQYNIMADMYASPGIYPYITDLRLLEWKYRKERILDEVNSYDPDIICMQEVEEKVHPELQDMFGKDKYDSTYLHNHQGEGCSVFWKKNRFVKKKEKLVRFNNCASSCLDLAQENESSPNSPEFLLGRYPLYQTILLRMTRMTHHNVAILVWLEEIFSDGTPNKPIVVGCTHLYWGYKDFDCNYQNQIFEEYFLLQEMKQFIEIEINEGALKPSVCLLGDFNSGPQSGVGHYQFLSRGVIAKDDPNLAFPENPIFEKVHESFEDQVVSAGMDLTHPFNLQSAYATCFENDLKWTCYVGHFQGCVDQIWYSCGETALTRKIDVTRVLDLYPEDVYQKEVALPSRSFGSDHMMLCVEIE